MNRMTRILPILLFLTMFAMVTGGFGIHDALAVAGEYQQVALSPASSTVPAETEIRP
jgi:hypothetical protein